MPSGRLQRNQRAHAVTGHRRLVDVESIQHPHHPVGVTLNRFGTATGGAPVARQIHRQRVEAMMGEITALQYPNRVTLKFCPEHYDVYMNEVIPAMPLKYKILTKIALKMGAIKVLVLKHMQSDLCFYCRFGSGGHGKKNELPPI
uniref:Uncharacterized protein n=1 Tax=uncultured marine thaumarchaeote KM3_61_F08 TaxID=1456214 RepID=A0A075HFR6_9ARCH|nr:hypothetical protein [uncultured marine thaumarchaeote KM3_61_F08]